jgi:hypothetical protein
MTDSAKTPKSVEDRTLNTEDVNYALSLLSAEGDTRPSFKAGLLSVVSYMLFGISFTSFITGLVTVWFDGTVGKNFFIIFGISLVLFGVLSIIGDSSEKSIGDITEWRESKVGKAVEEVWKERDRSWIAGCFLMVVGIVSIGGIAWFTYHLETSETIHIPGLLMIFLPMMIVIGVMGYLFLKEELFYAQAYQLRDKLEGFKLFTEAGDSGTVSSRDYQFLSQVEKNQIQKVSQQVTQESYQREVYGVLISPAAMETLETQEDFLQVRRLTSQLEANPVLDHASAVPEHPGEFIIQQNNLQITYRVDEILKRIEILSVARQDEGGANVS